MYKLFLESVSHIAVRLIRKGMYIYQATKTLLRCGRRGRGVSEFSEMGEGGVGGTQNGGVYFLLALNRFFLFTFSRFPFSGVISNS